MPFDNKVAAKPAASLPLQFIDAQITPLIDGRFSVCLHATLLDEEQLEFVGQDLANAYVDTLDEALVVIRTNVAVLTPTPSPAAA